MIGMHDWRADGQLGKIAQHGFRFTHGDCASPSLLRALAVKLSLGEDGERRLGESEAVVERSHRDAQARSIQKLVIPAFDGMTSRREKRLPCADGLRLQLRRSQLLDQCLAPSGRIRSDQDAAGIIAQKVSQLLCWCFATPIQWQARRRLRTEIDCVFICTYCNNVDTQTLVELFAQTLRRQVQFGDRQDRTFNVVGAAVVTRSGLLPEDVGSVECVFRQHEQRLFAKIVEQGFGVLEEQRQVVFDTSRRRAFFQILVDRTAARVDRKTLAQSIAEAFDRGLRQREFARRQQVRLYPLCAASAGFRHRRCGWSRFRDRTVRCDTVRRCPSGRCRAMRRARHSRRVPAPAGHCDSQMLRAGVVRRRDRTLA